MVSPDTQSEGPPDRAAPRQPGWFGRSVVAFSMIGTVLIVLMAIGVNADVIGRNLFNRPVGGVTEFLGLAIVSVVFLQIANASREERHIANDLIMSAVGLKWPRLAKVFYGLFQLAGAAIFGLMVWFVIPIFIENYYGGYYKGTAGYVEIPVWPFVGTVIVGAALACLQYILLALREFRDALRKSDV